MLETVKKLLLISRPVSWPNTAYPFVAGYLVSGGADWSLIIIGGLYFLVPYNLLMYGINDVFDYESDIRNPRKGGIEGMKVQRQFHPMIIRAVILTNLPFLVALYALGNGISAIVLTIVIFFVIAYSIAVLRFKERPLLDSITSSLHFVGPLLFALSLTPWNSAGTSYIIAFFLWGIASHAFGAVQDIIPDRQAKLSSVATFLGARTTMVLAFVLYAIASGILLVQPLPFTIIGLAGLVYCVNIFRYLTLTDATSMKANIPWRRFIGINLFTGFVITMTLCFQYVL